MPKLIEPISKSLTLPEGYQHWNPKWFGKGSYNQYDVALNTPQYLKQKLLEKDEELYLYTQHEIYIQDGLMVQTRSSPNIEGGLVTYATCKHLMRTYKDREEWEGVWIGGLSPKHCQDNTLFFLGRVDRVFPSNYHMTSYLIENEREVWKIKRAITNPRGDCYSTETSLDGEFIYDHRCYVPPENHTRSTEFYKKSPGSTSEREDGKIPKWWRDIEYHYNRRRPPCFILSPCFLFSRPIIWTTLRPGRAALRVSTRQLAATLQTRGAAP